MTFFEQVRVYVDFVVAFLQVNDGQFLNKVRDVPSGSGRADLHNLVFPVSLKFFFIACSVSPRHLVTLAVKYWSHVPSRFCN